MSSLSWNMAYPRVSSALVTPASVPALNLSTDSPAGSADNYRRLISGSSDAAGPGAGKDQGDMSTQAPVIERPSGTHRDRPTAHRHLHRDAHCLACGYGVTIYREPLRCPMCGGNRWVADDSPAE